MNIPFPNKAFFIGDGISEKEYSDLSFEKRQAFGGSFIMLLSWQEYKLFHYYCHFGGYLQMKNNNINKTRATTKQFKR